jgi:hypothetical protein
MWTLLSSKFSKKSRKVMNQLTKHWARLDRIGVSIAGLFAIEKITIASTDHVSDSRFKTEILGGLNGADVEFVDPSANDGEYGIVAVYLTTPSGVVRLE